MELKEAVQICRALGDLNRLSILSMISEEEMCASELLEHFNITQPTLSHHMKQLRTSKIVNVKHKGKNSYYSINHELLNEFLEFIKQL